MVPEIFQEVEAIILSIHEPDRKGRIREELMGLLMILDRKFEASVQYAKKDNHESTQLHHCSSSRLQRSASHESLLLSTSCVGKRKKKMKSSSSEGDSVHPFDSDKLQAVIQLLLTR